jgi:hemolysin activation/secretion protein
VRHGLLALLLVLVTTLQSANAQLPLPPPLPKLPELPPPVPTPPLVVPAPPKGPPPPEGFPTLRVFVREIRLVGNTAFTAQELAEVTDRYLNRELTTEDFEALRLALTLYYVNRGYATSGAILPDQAITAGVVTIQIIEGKLTQIAIEGNRWFRSSYLRNRIALGAGPPLNVNVLQERLQLLQTDSRIQRLNAELRPGEVLGESALNVRIADANPFRLRFEVNNFQSPPVGSVQGFVTAEDQNLLGFGDALSLQYGRSEGVNPILNFRYELPVTARDTTLAAQYRRFDFTVQQGSFAPLDIQNKAQIYSVFLRQPLYRSLDQEFAVSLTGEYEINKSSLLGAPFDFIPGSSNGEFKVSALRFSQDWVRRAGNQVFSASSRFSFGLDLLDATVTSSSSDANAKFFSWLGQGQWLWQPQPWRVQVIGRGVVQLTDTHLFPLEQIAVGGRYSVRGYREYTLVRDNATLASLEARIPIVTTAAGVDLVHLAPFVDYGRAWETNVTTPTSPPETLASVGLGLLVDFWEWAHFEVYWGAQLNHFRAGNDDLQDYGIHFQLVAYPF